LDPPVRYYGQVWIRIGPRRAIAGRDEERVLTERRQSGDLPFDRRAPAGATLDALDLNYFRNAYLPAAVGPDVLEENARSVDEQLSALHLLSPDGRPAYAALLLLGKDPRAWLPGAYVQFVRYDGTDLAAPIVDQKELDGPVADVLRRIDDLASINVRVATSVSSTTIEKRQPDYPLPALQQILRNAVLHRTYETNAPVYWYWFSGRMEVHSPGGLYGRVNEQNFGTPGATDYRNPTLAQGLKVLGYIQRFGMGIEIARKACRDNGNPDPEFRFSTSTVLAVLRSVG
jgi:ATP-dependent DNA helicase RecG